LKRYETLFIVQSELSSDDITATIDRYSKIITDMKGTVLKVERWGKRKLAYLIRKQSRGFYILIDFAGRREIVAEIERILKFDDKVLKYMSVKLADSITAEEIEKEFPLVFVETFAYQYTRKAPSKVRPRANVLIRLCSIECSFLQPLEGSQENAPFAGDLAAWGRIASGNLFGWDYVTSFSSYMLSHPNLRVLGPNIRTFVKNGATGLFVQGDALCSAGDFVRLRHWVLSHLLWNPDLDEGRLIDTFLCGYYGEKTGAALKRYLDFVHDRAEHSGVYLGSLASHRSP